jgi:cation diffusion facilitator CzcD-associated flavoprotein CzcO
MKVAIVAAGFSGIGLGATLQCAGREYAIFGRGSGAGCSATWRRANRGDSVRTIRTNSPQFGRPPGAQHVVGQRGG